MNIGDYYEDQNKRSPGRRVWIIGFEWKGKDRYAIVQTLVGGRVTRVRCNQLTKPFRWRPVKNEPEKRSGAESQPA